MGSPIGHTLQGLRWKLWVPIVVNTSIMTLGLGKDLAQGIEIGLVLCMVASAGFLLNDVCDRPIDRINRANRLEGLTDFACSLVTGLAMALALMAVAFSALLSSWASAVVAILCFGVVAYSVIARPILLLANLLAAVLAASPLWVPCVLWPRGATLVHWGTAGAMATILLAREIVLDIKDREGDRTSRRVTLPIKFGARASLITAAVLSVVALGVQGGLLIVFAGGLPVIPAVMMSITFLLVASLIEWPLLNLIRNRSRLDLFFRSSRVAMLVAPGLLLIEWLARR